MNETQLQQWLQRFEEPSDPEDVANLSSEDIVTLVTQPGIYIDISTASQQKSPVRSDGGFLSFVGFFV